jgi:Bacterial TniB protein
MEIKKMPEPEEEFSHLDPSVRHLLHLPPSERAKKVLNERWIGHDAAVNAVNELEDAFSTPKSRRSNILLVASPGNGKSSLLKFFSERHPIQSDPLENPEIPIVIFDMPHRASEKLFWAAILNKQGVLYRERDSDARRASLVLQSMRIFNTKMLIIDEFHNALHGSTNDKRQMLALIKNLINELEIPIVAAGTREAAIALNTDSQLTSRFGIVTLPRWELNKDFLRLLGSLERLLPLPKPSDFASREIATKIYGATDGTIGSICDLLKRAAKIAILNGEDCVNSSIIGEAKRLRASDFAEAIKNV